jgi:hypothetical protein
MSENPLACLTCGRSLAVPEARTSEVAQSLADEDSARCARLRQVAEQRRALADAFARGDYVGPEDSDTVDLVMRRESMARLDGALAAEAESLAKSMWHAPGWK